MKKAFVALGLLLLAWLGAWWFATRPPQPSPPPPADEALRLDPQRASSVKVAPRREALTFARFLEGEALHLLLVSRYENGKVTGIDLFAEFPDIPSDPIELFNAKGYEALQRVSGPEITIDAAALQLPFDGTDNQIAVGVNYPSHGDEVDVSDSFLFPKRVAATPHDADVPARDHLLDYEIELGFVLLDPLPRGAMPAFMGLVLASDYTDRAALLRHVRLTDVSSGEGFTQGKSAPGLMPIGPLFVIPFEFDSWYRSLKLELWHNGVRRQLAEPERMNWDVRRIADETFAREDRTWTFDGQRAALPIRNGVVPARTLILSGTPDGVLYAPPTRRQLFAGISEMIFTLRWAHPNHIVEPHLREAYASGRFLEPGDDIVMRADYLGVIRNRIVGTTERQPAPELR